MVDKFRSISLRIFDEFFRKEKKIRTDEEIYILLNSNQINNLKNVN